MEEKEEREEKEEKEERRESGKSMRVVALGPVEEERVEVTVEEDSSVRSVELGEFGYMKYIVRKGTNMNLLDVQEGKDGSLRPQYVVYEPDILVDISTIASCFTPHSNTHRQNLINKLKANETTKATLLGNFAGQLLDDELNRIRCGIEEQPDFKAQCKRLFRKSALPLLTTVGVDKDWFEAAKDQRKNICEMLRIIKDDVDGFNPEKIMTEPSFICEKAGVQGRMDMLQNDFKILVEQKSGKKDEFHKQHQESHYAQIILYQLVLRYGFGIRQEDIAEYLMYSRYPAADGLMREGGNPQVMSQKIFETRNKIVADELRYTKAENIRKDIESWTVESFREKRVADNYWIPWVAPQIANVLETIKSQSGVLQDYFYRFAAFLYREKQLHQVGNKIKEDSGFAAMWNTSTEDRRQAGNLIDKLKIEALESDEEEEWQSDVVDIVELGIDTEGKDVQCAPNFRRGDIVVLYDYAKDTEPDVRHSIECRASLVSIGANKLRVKLRSPQPKGYFEKERKGRLWAVEHDYMESHSTGMLRQLMTLLSGTKRRQELIVGLRSPEVDSDCGELKGDYGDMNEVVRKAMSAKDMFLLVGPPGTGKTSYGLMSILKEQMARKPEGNILLMAYTNRAVDEICSKLEGAKIDYMRIGSRLSCGEAYKPHLLGQQEFSNRNELSRKIDNYRVVVATTASMQGSSSLFVVKHFDLAIVDEASQILEPDIVGLLSAKYGNGEGEAIDRFVLIGDHKQLPAVVSQEKTESVIEEKSLREIGFEDCRQSYFERMCRQHGEKPGIMHTLSRQGRMHKETAEFCNEAFYEGKLEPIPLKHQEGELSLMAGTSASQLRQLLSTRRALFIDYEVEMSRDVRREKVNKKEAGIVAKTALEAIRIRKANGIEIDADKTLGIVVPYRNQIVAIRTQIIEMAETDEEREWADRVTIDTVERLQGSEREVIIYGMTVSRPMQMDFLTDSQFTMKDGTTIDRKLNVATSRAKEQLILVGASTIIRGDRVYDRLYRHVESKDSVVVWDRINK